MTSRTLHASGPVHPDTAWQRYAVLDRWADWAPQISRVESAGSRIAPGLTGIVVGPLGLTVHFVVDEVDEIAWTWTWTARVGPVRLRLQHAVTAVASGSATTLRVTGPLPIVIGYLPVAALAIRRLVAR